MPNVLPHACPLLHADTHYQTETGCSPASCMPPPLKETQRKNSHTTGRRAGKQRNLAPTVSEGKRPAVECVCRDDGKSRGHRNVGKDVVCCRTRKKASMNLTEAPMKLGEKYIHTFVYMYVRRSHTGRATARRGREEEGDARNQDSACRDGRGSKTGRRRGTKREG